MLRSARSTVIFGGSLMYAIELFHRLGVATTFRWLHILMGITWIGLLYYFNLVQVPAFAEMR